MTSGLSSMRPGSSPARTTARSTSVRNWTGTPSCLRGRLSARRSRCARESSGRLAAAMNVKSLRKTAGSSPTRRFSDTGTACQRRPSISPSAPGPALPCPCILWRLTRCRGSVPAAGRPGCTRKR